MIFLLSSDPDNLATVLAQYPSTGTVEAEYGDRLVEGSAFTLAHHGPRTGHPAPCSYPNGIGEGVDAVGLSHIDLDSLGGCLAALGRKPEAPSFWDLAEFVDLNGPHRLPKAGASEGDLERLYAFWAWSQKNRVFPPRDGSVVDVTESALRGASAIERILDGDGELLDEGRAFRVAEGKLNLDSFVQVEGDVVVRVAPSFVNHLYDSPEGESYAAVIALNPSTGSITLSFADPPTGSTAVEIVQSLWGPTAGGHAGIAGSPRGMRMKIDDLVRTATATVSRRLR